MLFFLPVLKYACFRHFRDPSPAQATMLFFELLDSLPFPLLPPEALSFHISKTYLRKT